FFEEQVATNSTDNLTHANFLQNGFGTPTSAAVPGSMTVEFNTVINHYNYGQGSAFFQVDSAANGSCSYNTLLSRPFGPAGAGPSVRIPVFLDPASANSYWNGKVNYNYFDPSGIWDENGVLWTTSADKAQFILGTNGTGSWGPRTFTDGTGNINMRNGKHVAI